MPPLPLCFPSAHAHCSGEAQPSTVTFQLSELSTLPADSYSNISSYQTLVVVGGGAAAAVRFAPSSQQPAPVTLPFHLAAQYMRFGLPVPLPSADCARP